MSWHNAVKMLLQRRTLDIHTCVLQEAAGYFKLLHDVAAPQLDEVPSFDISTNCTEMLELLMLAQAQESFYQKASRDRKNPAVLTRWVP